MRSQLNQLFFLLNNRATMLLYNDDSYSSLVNFFIGYELSINHFSAPETLSFNEWLMQEEGRRFSANWSSYILQKNENNEERSKEMLLKYFEAYIKTLSFQPTD
ncbi:MAG: hypothetical protein ACRBG0_16675 [Lewinella sp.]|uniref:hypothetical protein n=1 Tax=Lewinella sp. TaxID=2004506 RepID=UPI003D6B7CB4